MITFDPASETATADREASRLYHCARRFAKHAEKAERQAGLDEKRAAAARRHPVPGAVGPEAWEQSAEAWRKMAGQDRRRVPQYRAWARQAAAQGRLYRRITR